MPLEIEDTSVVISVNRQPKQVKLVKFFENSAPSALYARLKRRKLSVIDHNDIEDIRKLIIRGASIFFLPRRMAAAGYVDIPFLDEYGQKRVQTLSVDDTGLGACSYVAAVAA